ncbi:uncharacterized protein LOC129588452 [Paramacrobiotus metropolitanus]|uniref:uncharacterized protein LOC129588452 n=1 Tax=Paramacrobiotus metropolitanus TaxID=2943436 RepID=UPI0024460823|nr:uncharacterized protein LOC129588452 [Paramacrobiotus metropolitanus]
MDSKIAAIVVALVVYAFTCDVVNAAEQFKGEATYTTPGMGACEINAREGQMVANINQEQFGQFSRARDSPWCKKCVLVKATKFKTSVTVKIVDRSLGKKGKLVLSAAAFKKLASTDEGRIDITWSEVPCPKGI